MFIIHLDKSGVSLQQMEMFSSIQSLLHHQGIALWKKIKHFIVLSPSLLPRLIKEKKKQKKKLLFCVPVHHSNSS